MKDHKMQLKNSAVFYAVQIYEEINSEKNLRSFNWRFFGRVKVSRKPVLGIKKQKAIEFISTTNDNLGARTKLTDRDRNCTPSDIRGQHRTKNGT